MGPSGCGTTTTLRRRAGLETPSAGTITPAVPVSFLSEEFAGTGITCHFETVEGAEWKAQVTEAELTALAAESGDRFWLSWDPANAHAMAGGA